MCGRCLVERLGDWSPPIDEEFLAVGIRHPDAADVATSPVDQVEAPEAEALLDVLQVALALGVEAHECVALGTGAGRADGAGSRGAVQGGSRLDEQLVEFDVEAAQMGLLDRQL